MRILLDTQAAIILADREQGGIEGIGKKARSVVEDASNELLLSAVSLTEIAVKSKIGKLAFFNRNRATTLVQDLQLTLVPYSATHAMRLFDLPLHHKDPFDRMLIATALVEGIPMVSADKQFTRYKGMSVLW